MHRDRLLTMGTFAVGFDTETHRIRRGLPAPPMVCGSVAWPDSAVAAGIASAILDKDPTRETFVGALEDERVVLAGANLAYDLIIMAVDLAARGIDAMPWIFRFLEQGRGFDILIAEQLGAIAGGYLDRDPRTGGTIKNPETGKQGGYSLATVVDMVLGRIDAKANDTFRLRYHELDGIPIAEWPQAAVDYPRDDAVNTLQVCLAQTGVIPRLKKQHRFTDESGGRVCGDCGSTTFSSQCSVRAPIVNVHQVAEQTYSAFCLSLGAAWGLCVDQSAVDVIERYTLRRRTRLMPPFIAAGILREDESEDRAVIKKMIATAYGAKDPCAYCNGTGKVPSAAAKPIRCPDCRGYCLPDAKTGPKCNAWRASNPNGCATCGNTGKVANPNPPMVTCVRRVEVVGKSGELELDEEKTCDGTGLILVESVPRSDKEGVSYGRDALGQSGDDFLMTYGDFLLAVKTLGYVAWFRTARVPSAGHAIECPTHVDEYDDCTCAGPYIDVPMNLRPNSILATGRVSYRGLVQLLPRKPGFKDPETDEYIPSLRECFVARGPTYRYVEVPDDHVLQLGEERVAC